MNNNEIMVTEHSIYLGEEYTLVFAVQFLLGIVGKRGPVCKNLSTTRAVDLAFDMDFAPMVMDTESLGPSVKITDVRQPRASTIILELTCIIGQASQCRFRTTKRRPLICEFSAPNHPRRGSYDGNRLG